MSEIKDKFEDRMWHFIERHRPFKIILLVLLTVSLVESNIKPILPFLNFAYTKIKYLLEIRPSEQELLKDKHAFLSGLYVYEALNLRKNIDDDLDEYLTSRIALIRSFEVLGFREECVIPPVINGQKALFERVTRLQMLRDRYEGFLEKQGTHQLALYHAAFHLRALIDQLHAPIPDKLRVIEENNDVVAAWKKAQDDISYKLPSLSINTLTPLSNFSQPDAMRDAVGTYNTIRAFFGRDK